MQDNFYFEVIPQQILACRFKADRFKVGYTQYCLKNFVSNKAKKNKRFLLDKKKTFQ